MTNFVQDDKCVTVTVVDKAGVISQFWSKYLVACDGGRSPIRERLGKRHGVGYVRGLRSILFRCAKIENYLDHGYSQFQVEKNGFEAFMTTYGDGRWMLAWHEEDLSPFIDETAQRNRVRKATGLDLLNEEIKLITTGKWDIGGFIAERYSSGRIFLAGVSVHTLPPNRGGYGANTGMADAHNIAYKLAAVLNGESHPELLQTYEEERRPVAQVRHDQIVAREDHRRYIQDRDWLRKDVEIIDDVSMEFGQLYHSGSIIGACKDLPNANFSEEWKGQPGIRAPHVVLRRGNENEGDLNTLFGLEKTGATLIRPDGFIAWRAVSKQKDAQDALIQAFARASYAK